MLVKDIHDGIVEYPMAEVSIEVGANKEICEVVLLSQLTEEDAIIDSDVPFFNDVVTYAGE